VNVSRISLYFFIFLPIWHPFSPSLPPSLSLSPNKTRMANNTQVRVAHDRGAKHTSNVAKKLSEMRRKADIEKKEEATAAKSIAQIEAAARKQFALDLADKAISQHKPIGDWKWDAPSSYYYHARVRWYYDPKSKMYYGGEPSPDWTNTPGIPYQARFEVATEKLGGQPIGNNSAPGLVISKSLVGGGGGSSTTASAGVRIGGEIQPLHPLAGVGGSQMPSAGRIGGAKGVGSLTTSIGDESGRSTKEGIAVKRKRDEEKEQLKKFKALPKEEQEAIAKRELAKKRVQQREAAFFGLK
jgi:WW domain-binding protein 4